MASLLDGPAATLPTAAGLYWKVSAVQSRGLWCVHVAVAKGSGMLRRLLSVQLFFVFAMVATSQVFCQEPAATTTEAPPAQSKPALTAEQARRLGELIRDDWKDRPEWADMAVAILTSDSINDLGMGRGWYKPVENRYYWSFLRQNFDADKDRKVTKEELPKSLPQADKFFERLDRDANGAIEAVDFDWSSFSPYMMRKQMSNGVFSRLDFDSNGRVDEEEILNFFQRADRDNLGFVTPDDLLIALDPPSPTAPRETAPRPKEDPLKWLGMLLNGELGSLTAGPGLDDKAPDFTLPLHDGSGEITLSKLVGDKPVVLIFGSFT